MYEKILVVDDEEDIVSLIKDALEDENYTVFTACNGFDAIEKLKLNPELILLDVMMPGMDGFEVCKVIRDSVSCPIIFLTAKSEEESLLKGLALGGDDYMSKPFSIKALKMKVLSHIRREKRSSDVSYKNYLSFDGLTIDLKGREIKYKEIEIPFTKREFDIIEVLSLNPGQTFSKEQIYEKVWGYDAEGDASTVAEHVKKARAKLHSLNSDKDYIATVWGVGYKWEK